MLTPEVTNGLRLFAEGVMVVWSVFTAKREIQKRRQKNAPLSIAGDELDEFVDRRSGVRRSELNVLIRKLAELAEKVDALTDAVTDHQNRLDELDTHRTDMALALRELTSAIGGIRGDIAALRAS